MVVLKAVVNRSFKSSLEVNTCMQMCSIIMCIFGKDILLVNNTWCLHEYV